MFDEVSARPTRTTGDAAGPGLHVRPICPARPRRAARQDPARAYEVRSTERRGYVERAPRLGAGHRAPAGPGAVASHGFAAACTAAGWPATVSGPGHPGPHQRRPAENLGRRARRDAADRTSRRRRRGGHVRRAGRSRPGPHATLRASRGGRRHALAAVSTRPSGGSATRWPLAGTTGARVAGLDPRARASVSR